MSAAFRVIKNDHDQRTPPPKDAPPRLSYVSAARGFDRSSDGIAVRDWEDEGGMIPG